MYYLPSKTEEQQECLYIALILIKYSFEMFVYDWESNAADKCGLEYYYVSVLHLILVIKKLIK
jgi:hypothetical protein